MAVDEPPEIGGVPGRGTNTAMNPLELLLNALGGCLCITAAASRRMLRGGTLKGVRAKVEGDVDFDGILGRNPGVRKGLSEIRAEIYLDTDAPDKSIKEFAEFVHQSCPVSDNLAHGAVLKVTAARGK